MPRYLTTHYQGDSGDIVDQKVHESAADALRHAKDYLKPYKGRSYTDKIYSGGKRTIIHGKEGPGAKDIAQVHIDEYDPELDVARRRGFAFRKH